MCRAAVIKQFNLSIHDATPIQPLEQQFGRLIGFGEITSQDPCFYFPGLRWTQSPSA